MAPGFAPPKYIPLVLFPAPPTFLLAVSRSPKSVAFAVFAMVIKSIIFVNAGESKPPAVTALVELPTVALCL